MNRLDKITEQRKIQGVKWKELAESLPISAEGLRIAFSRGSVDPAYLKLIEEKLGITETTKTEHKKTSPGEVRFEDVISKKVMEGLAPYLNDFQAGHKIVNEQLRDIAELLHELAAQVIELRTELEEIKSSCDATDKNVKAVKKNLMDVHQVIVEQE